MVVAYPCLLMAAGLVACSLSQPHWYTGVASSRGNLTKLPLRLTNR